MQSLLFSLLIESVSACPSLFLKYTMAVKKKDHAMFKRLYCSVSFFFFPMPNTLIFNVVFFYVFHLIFKDL